MAKLTPSQERLVKAGLLSPEDFVTTPSAKAPTSSGLTASQRRLVEAGLLSPEDFVEAVPERPADPSKDPANAARLAQYQQEAEAWRNNDPNRSLLGRLGTTIVEGYKAASPEVGETMFALAGGKERVINLGTTLDTSDPLMGLKAVYSPLIDLASFGADIAKDQLTSDRTLAQSAMDAAITDRADLAEAKAARDQSRRRLEAAVGDSIALRTVGDVASSAESFLGLPAAAVGTAVGGPAGTVAGAAIGSVPSARKAFFNAYADRAEALEAAAAARVAAGQDPGITQDEIHQAATEHATKMTANEFGTETALSVLPFAKALNTVGGASLARQVATRAGAAILGEGAGEAVVGAVGNEINRTTGALDPNALVRQVAQADTQSVLSSEYWQNRGREFLGGAAGGAVVSPATIPTAVTEARAALKQQTENTVDRTLDNALEAQRRRDLEAFSVNNPTVAEAFVAGTAKAENDGIESLVDQLAVANESFSDTRFDRATKAIDSKLAELDQAASVVDTTQPGRRQREESKANVQEIDQLRTYIETMAPMAEAQSLGRNERRKLRQAIDRLNFLEREEAGRKALVEAKDMRGRLANNPDSEILKVAGEIDPSQDFTRITGPDLSGLSTPAPVTNMPRRAANMSTSQRVADVQAGMQEGQKQLLKEQKAQAKQQENITLEQGKRRREFVANFVKSNPQATEQEVMDALDVWEQTTAAPVETPAQQPASPSPVAAAPAAATGESLTFDDNAFLSGRNTPTNTSPGARTAMSPETEDLSGIDPELLASFEANFNATPDNNQVTDAPIEQQVLNDNPLKKASVEGGPRAVMNLIAEKAMPKESGGDPVVSRIARRLGPLLEAAGVKVEFPDTAISTANGPAAGMYIPGENKIQIGPDTRQDAELVEIATHEGLHAILQAVYKDASKFPNGKQAKKLLDDAMNRLAQARASGELARVIASLKPPSVSKAAQYFLQDRNGMIFQDDGTIEPDEFIAYGKTNPAVRRVFKEIKMPGNKRKSIWSTFKDAARSLLGMKEDESDSVLDRLMEGAEGLIAGAEQAPEQLQRSVADNRRAAIEAATNNDRAATDQELPNDTTSNPQDRAAMAAPKAPEVSTKEALLEGTLEGASPEQGTVGRAVDAVANSGRVGKFVVNALVRTDARIPTTMREAQEAARNRVQAAVLDAMGMIRTMNDMVRERRGTMSTTAALNEFSMDFNEMLGLKQKLRDNKDVAENTAKLAALQARMKDRWGEAYTMLEKAQADIDEQSMVIMEQIIRSAPVSKDGKRMYTQQQIRELNAIKANLGMYVSREFANNSRQLQEEHRAAFSDPKNKKAQQEKDVARKYLREKSLNIPPAENLMRYGIDHLRDLASTWVGDMPGADKEAIVEALGRVRDNPAIYNEETLNRVVERELTNIIEGKDSVTSKRYQSMALDDRILKEREAIPPELLPVMGEVRNAGLQILTTLHRQSVLAESMKAYSEIYNTMKGRAVFDTVAEAPSDFVKLSDGFGALAGKLVHPNVAEVLGRVESLQEDFTKVFSDPQQMSNVMVNALSNVGTYSKAATLLPNLFAWAMNLYGSIMLPVATGSWRSLPAVPKALSVALVKMPGVWMRKDIPDEVLEVFKRGLEDSGHAAEVNMESLRIAAETFRIPPTKAEQVSQSLMRTPSTVLRLAFDFYAGMDLWSKLVINYGEVKFLNELNAALPADRKMSPEEIRRVAAEWTKEVTPSYERSIPAANTLERVGIGFFMRYTAEVYRNSLNNFNRVKKEGVLAAQFKQEGLEKASSLLSERSTSRAIGATTATLLYPMVVSVFGSSMAAGLQALFGLDDEEDEEKKQLVIDAIKQDQPWLASKPLVVVGKDEAGWMVFDASRPLPQAPFQQLMSVLINPAFQAIGVETDYNMGTIMDNIKANSVSLSPAFQFVVNADGYRNRQPVWMRENSPVSRFMNENNIPDDGWIATALKASDMLTPAQLDAFLTTAEESPSQQILGFRPTRLDMGKMLQAYSINDELREQRRLLVDDLKEPATRADEEEIKAVAAKSIAVDLRRFRNVTARIELARANGMTTRQIVDTLAGTQGDRGSGLTKTEIVSMLNGNFMPSTLSERTLDTAMRQLMAEEGADRDAIRRQFAVLRKELQELRAAVRSGTYNPEE